MERIRFTVEFSCLSSPFINTRIPNESGLDMDSLDTTQGPIGQNPSRAL